MIPWKSTSAAVALVSVALPAAGQKPTLTTALAAHSLKLDAAGQAYPVHLRSVVTYYDAYTDPRLGAFFACDRTGCICVLVPPKPILPIRAGTLVDIIGVTDPGHFAPIVVASVVKVVGQSRLPAKSPQRGLAQLMTGADDGQWVQVDGVVHSVVRSGRNVTLAVALNDGMIQGITAVEPGVDYGRLVDSRVVIHANAAPLFNKNRQMVGARLLFPSLDQLSVKEPSPLDVFSLPASGIGDLLLFTPDPSFVHRVRVRGQVSLQWPGQWLVIQNGKQGLFVPTSQKNRLNLGDEVDVAGFPAMGEFGSTLEDAVFRRAGSGRPVDASPITAREAMKGDDDARLIQIRGRLVDVDLTSQYPTLMMSSEGTVFQAILPAEVNRAGMASWLAGSELQLTGICSVQVDKYLSAQREGAALPKSFRVLLRSPQDVVFVQKPSWWTAGRILVVLGIFVAMSIAGTLWVVALKRRVEEKTETIRATLESTTEGILVVNSSAKIVEHNRRFAAMWGIPTTTFLSLDIGALLDLVKPGLRDPDAFSQNAWSTCSDARVQTDSVVEFVDGRVFECHSEPQIVKGKGVGRVWGFRDVTESRDTTRQLQELAHSDALTGIPNRRAIFSFLSSELNRAQKRGDSLTVMMTDLDRFKMINDHFGHAAGDAVLREAAQRLRSGMRASDAIGRYGGEEFLIVLPQCDSRAGKARAEELRRLVESQSVIWETDDIPVTCSFGVASTASGNYAMEQLLHDADAALYSAKQAGRNCVAVAATEQCTSVWN
jgi:diguanylate cyclase (GGDEF)-like protein